MKYIVTGGAGFIGSNLVDLLIEEGHEVHVIDNFSSGKKENCNEKAQYFELDISDSNNYEDLKNILLGSGGVFHLAALPRVQESIDNPLHFEKNNTLAFILTDESSSQDENIHSGFIDRLSFNLNLDNIHYFGWWSLGDDWEWYHMALGEVHCGSNIQRTPIENWWDHTTFFE